MLLFYFLNEILISVGLRWDNCPNDILVRLGLVLIKTSCSSFYIDRRPSLLSISNRGKKCTDVHEILLCSKNLTFDITMTLHKEVDKCMQQASALQDMLIKNKMI